MKENDLVTALALAERAASQEMENQMVRLECTTDSRKPTLVPVMAEDDATPLCQGLLTVARSGDRAPTDTCARKRQSGASRSRRRRFDRVSIGFWLGGATLGTGGGILGACMPYHHAVAIAISVIWWGIYLGCFGASLGALFGMCTDKNRRTSCIFYGLGPDRFVFDVWLLSKSGVNHERDQ